jgi:hypothetical protein
MPLPLTIPEVADRLRDYSRENYLLLANVIKGLVLGSATITAIGIASDVPDNWPKLSAFACSGAAMLVSYVTWTRGVLLTNSRSNTHDAVLPLVMGGIEMSLFAILNTKTGWHFWFFALAMHSFLAVLLVRNRINNTLKEDFDSKLSELRIREKYIGWMKQDVAGATAGTVASVLFGAITYLLFWKSGQRVWNIYVGTNWGDWTFLILPLLPFFMILKATRMATRQLRELDENISKAALASGVARSS